MPENRRKNRWSADVTAHSDALALEPKVFEKDRGKSSPFRSAMSMLTFYINRAGGNLPPERKQTLEAAKEKLRKLFGRSH